ncbi:MAG: hypothetical protein IJU84_08870 [Clostridia bacterium]|nr:hypothetical protein [Clostridia bacterium]
MDIENENFSDENEEKKPEREVTAEAFSEVTKETEKPAEDEAKRTEFEKFLEQFPDADAEKTVRRAIKSGDFAEGCFTRQYVMSLKDEIAALKEETSSEEIITRKALASGKVTEAVVKEYLKAVAAAQPQIRRTPKGGAPVLPPSKPKTIAEAGALAGDIFKNKNV